MRHGNYYVTKKSYHCIISKYPSRITSNLNKKQRGIEKRAAKPRRASLERDEIGRAYLTSTTMFNKEEEIAKVTENIFSDKDLSVVFF